MGRKDGGGGGEGVRRTSKSKRSVEVSSIYRSYIKCVYIYIYIYIIIYIYNFIYIYIYIYNYIYIIIYI